MVKSQILRVQTLADGLPSHKIKVDCSGWKCAKFIPVILSLIPSSFKFCGNVPVVSVLQLQDFLVQMPALTESLRVFWREFQVL